VVALAVFDPMADRNAAKRMIIASLEAAELWKLWKIRNLGYNAHV